MSERVSAMTEASETSERAAQERPSATRTMPKRSPRASNSTSGSMFDRRNQARERSNDAEEQQSPNYQKAIRNHKVFIEFAMVESLNI